MVHDIDLPSLHRGQSVVAKCPARFRVLSCGRRWGKTLLGVVECIDQALQGKRAWWVAPNYKQALVAWRSLADAARQTQLATIHEADKRITWKTGGEIAMRSADAPESLRGDSLDFVVIDEAAHIPKLQAVWQEAIRPALTDRRGRALVISTPLGHNHFAELWHSSDTNVQAFRFPTDSNPYMPADEVEAARLALPERVFRQEYLAEFIADGAVFRNIDACVRPAPECGGTVVVGVDWGKQDDFSVFIAVDQASGHIVAIDRMNQVDYNIQIARLKQFVQQQGAAFILAEHNGIGQVLCDLCDQAGIPTRRFETTNASKMRIVGELVAAFDHERIGIPDHEVLLHELRAFTMNRSSSGAFTYSAPSGMHDDCVMALAFAWEARCLPTTLLEFV